jgi:hypothetical protein
VGPSVSLCLNFQLLVVVCGLRPLNFLFGLHFQAIGTLNMTFLRDYAKSINESIAKTAFGRVFRLQGCGHVSCAHITEGRDFFANT